MTDLVALIRNCDPGHYLTKKEVSEVLKNIEEVEQEELADMNGHLGWLYMKIKANADYHNLAFPVPERWAHLYEGYREDLKIYRLPKPLALFASLLRSWGLRKSFIRGEGSGSSFSK